MKDLGFSRAWFTWERGRTVERNIKERIDRGVANDGWFQQFPQYSLRYLPHSFSDHCPLLIDTEDVGIGRQSNRFRSEVWWVLEESCEAEIRKLWEGSFGSFLF